MRQGSQQYCWSRCTNGGTASRVKAKPKGECAVNECGWSFPETLGLDRLVGHSYPVVVGELASGEARDADESQPKNAENERSHRAASQLPAVRYRQKKPIKKITVRLS